MRQLKSRPPAVSGIFYPSNPSELRNPLNNLLDRKFGPITSLRPILIVGFMD